MHPRKILEEKLMCGFAKCCPTVRVFDDGSVELTDDDAAAGSVGTVRLRPEVADRLGEILAKRGR